MGREVGQSRLGASQTKQEQDGVVVDELTMRFPPVRNTQSILSGFDSKRARGAVLTVFKPNVTF